MSKRKAKGAAVEAAPGPFDSPRMMLVEVTIFVLENGVAGATSVIHTRTDDPQASAIIARFGAPVDAAAKALAAEISRAVSGDEEDPDVIPLGGPAKKSAPFVKPDIYGGHA